MPVKRKTWVGIILRSFGAVIIGVVAVVAFVSLLSLYGASQEPVVIRAAARPLAFPKNEQMLDALSERLAREGAALSGIEPAAGETAPAAPVVQNPQ